MQEKVKKVSFVIISAILGAFLSLVICYSLFTGRGMGGDCFLQRGNGSCITILSFAPDMLQTIVFVILSILIAVGVYRGLKELFK